MFNPDSKPFDPHSFAVPATPVKTRLLFHSPLVEGGMITGSFKIEGLGVFDFDIFNYGIPLNSSGGDGAVIQIVYQDKTTLSVVSVGEKIQGTAQEQFLANAFLVALAGAEGKITGVSPGTFLTYPLPPDMQCRSPSRP